MTRTRIDDNHINTLESYKFVEDSNGDVSTRTSDIDSRTVLNSINANLTSVDFATQTTLSSLNNKDFATQTTLEAVDSNLSSVICTDCDKIKVMSLQETEIHDGNHFFVCGFETIDADASSTFSIVVPNSTTHTHMFFEIEGTNQTEVYIYEDATITADVTATTPFNNNRNSTTASTLGIYKDTTISDYGDLIYSQSKGLTGARPSKAGAAGLSVSNDGIILKRNLTYIFKIISRGAGNIISYCGKWHEHTWGAEPAVIFANAASISFDGTAERLNGGDIHTYIESNSAFSIGFWVQSSLSQKGSIIAKTSTDGNQYGFLVTLSTSGLINVLVRSTSNYTLAQDFTSPTVSANTWTHITITYAGANSYGGFHVYGNAVDGQAAGSSSAIGNWQVNQDMTIGSKYSTANTMFKGDLDEITLWNVELSQAQVTELYNGGDSDYDPTSHSATVNLQSWYSMESDTFPTVTDKNGSDDLTMVGMDQSNFTSDIP